MARPRPPARISGLGDLTTYLAQLDDWMRNVEHQLNLAYGLSSFLSGSPAGPQATLSIPHNDTFPFADNVDGTHPANLRYVMPANVQRVASARLSIHLAPYRTYNSFSLSTTGSTTPSTDSTGSSGHSHSHAHGIPVSNNNFTNFVKIAAGTFGNDSGSAFTVTDNSDATGESGHSHSHNHGSHNHTISGSSVLGVTEGAVATGVTIAFDGVDRTAALGGPFNADVVELDVTKYLPATKGVWHTIAMQPSGLGRIEAHLRLSVFVNAGVGF